jgi:hypothetical protein
MNSKLMNCFFPLSRRVKSSFEAPHNSTSFVGYHNVNLYKLGADSYHLLVGFRLSCASAPTDTGASSRKPALFCS